MSQISRELESKTYVYELETLDEWELDFAIYLLFEDLHRLRAETRKIWGRVKRGEITVIHATLLMSACVELVRLAEEEVYSMFSSVFPGSKDLTYEHFVGKIYNSEVLGGAGEQDINCPTLEISEFDEFIFSPLGWTLNRLKVLRVANEKGMWPVPVPPMRLNYIVSPELLNSSRMKRFEEQDKLLIQIYHDMVLLDQMKFNKLAGQPLAGQYAEIIKESCLPFDDILHTSVWQLQVCSFSRMQQAGMRECFSSL